VVYNVKTASQINDMLHSSIAALILLISLGEHTFARNLNQPSGEISLPHNEIPKRHMGPNGRPCLALDSYAKSQIINKNVFEHWIRATNTCGQHIELRVCYHTSNDCIAMNVPPWDTKSSVLGIYPMKDFQYDAKEKF
jgi:hypothetical protein